jgi:hypothetical protein
MDIKTLLREEGELSEAEYRRNSLVIILVSAGFLIIGPVLLYFGFLELTSPFTCTKGALFIAIGFLILMFGFHLWQDRHYLSLRRLITLENARRQKEHVEIRDLILQEQKKQ